MPAKVVLPQAEHLPKVLAGGGEELTVNIKHDPVNNPPVAIRPPLGLPPLPGTDPEGSQVIDQFSQVGQFRFGRFHTGERYKFVEQGCQPGDFILDHSGALV